jgi:hypothetical protein
MLEKRYLIAGGVILVLLVANLISWFFSDWGLITVTVKDAPLGQVIKSIERQGWVTIYTDLDPATKVSMYVVKVPLAEAMESLTANLGGPDASGNRTPGAEWHLGFFAAPNATGVKQEIHAFQTDTLGDDTKVYSYPTPLQMLSAGTSNADDDAQMPAADPRAQIWPGYHAPPTPAPVPNANTDGQPAPAADPPPGPPTTLQDYFQAVAQEADVWLLAPASWSPNVAAPAANISIASAVKKLVSHAHGSVQQAIVLRARQGRGGGGGPRGGGFADNGWFFMEDRVRNAINGLPPEARPAALASLNAEDAFRKDVAAAPPDQRREMMRQHFMNRAGQNNWRRSPAKRAQMYQRAVANRQAARGQ